MSEKLQKLDDLVSLCKRRGFIFQSSEIYGGLKSAYDYGPLGVELKLDFILNHASVLSPQFQDLIQNGVRIGLTGYPRQ